MSISKDARRAIYEANVHMTIGLFINGWLTWLIFGTTPMEAAGYTAIFFSISWVRQIAVSSYFRRKARLKQENNL